MKSLLIFSLIFWAAVSIRAATIVPSVAATTQQEDEFALDPEVDADFAVEVGRAADLPQDSASQLSSVKPPLGRGKRFAPNSADRLTQRIVPQRIVPQRIVPQRIVPQRIVPQRIVPQRIVPQRIVPQRIVPQRIVPQRIVPQRIVPQRIVPQRIVPQRIAH